MVKKVVTDAFEQLGQTAGQAAQQVVQEPGKMAETAAQQTGLSEPSSEQPQGQTSDPARMAQKKAQSKRLITAFEAELRDIRSRQVQELPKQVSGKPGFSEEKAIKQLKVKQKEEKELPVVAAAKKKGGTGERRSMGGSS